MTQEPPQDIEIGHLKELADIYRSVKKDYLEALKREQDAWTAWFDSVQSNLGPETKVTGLVGELRAAIADFEDAGLLGAHFLPQLRQSLDGLNSTAIDRALESLRLSGDSVGRSVSRIAAAARLKNS